MPIPDIRQTNSFGTIEANRPVIINNNINIEAGSFNCYFGSQVSFSSSFKPETNSSSNNVQYQHNRQKISSNLRKSIQQYLSNIQDALALWDFNRAGEIALNLDLLLAKDKRVLHDEIVLDAVMFSARAHINMADTSQPLAGEHIKCVKHLLSKIVCGSWGNTQSRFDEITALQASIRNLVLSCVS